MGRALVAVGMLTVLLVACHGPQVEYEYEKPVTITSSDSERTLFSPPPTTGTTTTPAPTTVTTTTPPTTLAPQRPSVWRRGEKQ